MDSRVRVEVVSAGGVIYTLKAFTNAVEEWYIGMTRVVDKGMN